MLVMGDVVKLSWVSCAFAVRTWSSVITGALGEGDGLGEPLADGDPVALAAAVGDALAAAGGGGGGPPPAGLPGGGNKPRRTRLIPATVAHRDAAAIAASASPT